MVRWGRFASAYALLGTVALVLVWGRGGSPLLHPSPHLELARGPAHGWSLGLGLGFAAVVVLASRLLVQRFAWARSLHQELRPFALGLDATGLFVLALVGPVGEELLFRALFQPAIGLLPQAILFGLVHYLPGRSRWAWSLWAFLFGLAMGTVFLVTGSLLGPIVAHVLVNALNSSFLRRHDPAAAVVERGVELST